MKKKSKSVIEKLDINLFGENVSKSSYERARDKFISEYKEYVSGHSGGFFGWEPGKYVKRPDVGEAEWNNMYPRRYESWAGKQIRLNTYGEQHVIDKINEIIDFIKDQK